MADISTATPHDLDRRPEGRYHTAQITAHWTIVFLVAFQFLTGISGMSAAYEAGVAAGELPPAGIIWVHGMLGTTILLVMLGRLALRRQHGAPPPPDTEPDWLQKISRGVHYAFYVFLIAMPLAGMGALWLKQGWLGALHALSAWILLALIVAHIAGALWHASKRDGVIGRILRGNSMP
ncbi:cytochrome b [Jannaschia sp. W003]|uniref:cytochrome b n=1 Tax=Jannaschia sp. W003 TaxID=2867012 RepID=UPI0021A826FE|nr:cytochrome b/b6 domain-containing protein [Jannaschia sp. W003]UWQ22298.1 cytochrome b/b6 domain-containing protein [Jannaschia sp. W003]